MSERKNNCAQFFCGKSISMILDNIFRNSIDGQGCIIFDYDNRLELDSPKPAYIPYLTKHNNERTDYRNS